MYGLVNEELNFYKYMSKNTPNVTNTSVGTRLKKAHGY
jgi:hypothetical protein